MSMFWTTWRWWFWSFWGADNPRLAVCLSIYLPIYLSSYICKNNSLIVLSQPCTVNNLAKLLEDEYKPIHLHVLTLYMLVRETHTRFSWTRVAMENVWSSLPRVEAWNLGPQSIGSSHPTNKHIMSDFLCLELGHETQGAQSIDSSPNPIKISCLIFSAYIWCMKPRVPEHW